MNTNSAVHAGLEARLEALTDSISRLAASQEQATARAAQAMAQAAAQAAQAQVQAAEAAAQAAQAQVQAAQAAQSQAAVVEKLMQFLAQGPNGPSSGAPPPTSSEATDGLTLTFKKKPNHAWV